MQCLSTTGNKWIQFRAYNTVTDAEIVCSQDISGVANSGTLNFDGSSLKWLNNTLATQSWVVQNNVTNNSPTLNGNPIVSYTSASCQIQYQSAQNNN